MDTGGAFGSSATLHVVVDGMPTPTVQWSKDGKDIFDKAGKYTTKVDGLNYYLTIENLEQKDLGAYTCKAANNIGQDECKAQVKESGPPGFITPIKDSMAVPGGNITFVCQTKGSPLPEVSWFLNGRPLTNKAGKINIEDL